MEQSQERVLAVGAHPDDVEFFCAGTLALLREAGWEVHVATLTQGDCGSSELGPQEIAAVRRSEAEAACRVLGVRYHYLGFQDFQIFVTDEANRRLTALLREIDPAIVLTHPPHDYMADHEVTSRLVRNGCFAAGVPNYDTTRFTLAPPRKGIPALYYAQPVENVDIFGERVHPAFFVDVSEQKELKLELLACHKSQREWLRSHHEVDEYLDSLRRWSSELGAEASLLADRQVEWAEGFRQHRGHAYPRENLLAQLLGDRVILRSQGARTR